MVVKAQQAAESLEQRMEAHRQEAARLRAVHGDPAAALGKLLHESVGLAALQETYQESSRAEPRVRPYRRSSYRGGPAVPPASMAEGPRR